MSKTTPFCLWCKYAIDEGEIWCNHPLRLGDYTTVDWHPDYGCDNFEEASG